MDLSKPEIQTHALEEVRRAFFERGTTVTDWARRHGFAAHAVYRVINGKSRALRGTEHLVAQALGLKPRPEGLDAASDAEKGAAM